MDTELKLLAPDAFPPLLSEIPDPPSLMYLRGTLRADQKWLAVVGSRAATAYGRQAVRYLIEGLRGYPITIVSGLAYGIDAEAHRAALDARLSTVAIPGSGLDWDALYPRANVGLAREILNAGGALLSEFAPAERAAAYMFPRRNRIVVGLSHAVLVVEAKERSGSLISARLAAEYNRDLLCVPGSIFSIESAGTNQFLRLGAAPATSPRDILEALGFDASAASPRPADLSDAEQRVLEAIASPCSRDELIAALEMPVTEANILLSAMEIKGLITEEFGTIRVR